MQPLVFSGVQPSGSLHIGNYLGAIKHWVALQSSHNCIYCIADMHALTVNPKAADLLQSTRITAATLLAAGIDPNKHILFTQSSVTQHAELAWIFSCVARVGWLQRMTQFKSKTGGNKEQSSVGLYTYPVLMAADILLYNTTYVPVGSDQNQHVELTRDIAKKFNHDYSTDLLQIPTALYYNVPRIMSLRDGKKKMSKSDTDDLSRINITDTADVIANKIRKAKTGTKFDKTPEVNNLLNIFAAFTNIKKEEAIEEFSNHQFCIFKQALIDAIQEVLAPIAQETNKLLQDTAYIDEVLRHGAECASVLAETNMKQIREIVGLRR